MVLAIIPTVVVLIIGLPFISLYLDAALASRISIILIFAVYIFFAITINFFTVFLKKQYRSITKILFLPAMIYYLLMIGLALTFATGLIGVIELGNIVQPNTVTKM
jgi:hypothetical protein